jgi:proline dehydrogenase
LLAEEFNKVTPANAAKGPAIPIVHNTYQCYLRTAPAAVEKSLARADAKGYSWGAKLVRGAYVESERAKWVKAGSVGECVVWASKAETDA